MNGRRCTGSSVTLEIEPDLDLIDSDELRFKQVI